MVGSTTWGLLYRSLNGVLWGTLLNRLPSDLSLAVYSVGGVRAGFHCRGRTGLRGQLLSAAREALPSAHSPPGQLLLVAHTLRGGTSVRYAYEVCGHSVSTDFLPQIKRAQRKTGNQITVGIRHRNSAQAASN